MQSLNIFVVHPSQILTDHLPFGAGWIVYNYLRGLAERGHVIHVAAPRVEMRDPVPEGMHVHLISPRSKPSRLAYIAGVRGLFERLSRSLRFDIAQQFTPVETGLSFALLGAGVPLVLGPYSGYWPADAYVQPRRESLPAKLKRGVRDSLAALQQKQARALVITCPAALNRIASPAAWKDKVHVIAHGIDSRGYRERTALPDGRSILFLSNLEYRKGIFTLLDAFDRMAAAIPDGTLEIWGDGSEAAAVERRASESPFHARIHIKGRAPREKVAEIMRSHSVYCMPSYGEPFGMTLLEAMASGVPIVTTDAGGPPHIVHSAGGRIVPMGNPDQLASALLEVLSSRQLQRSMGAYNRQRVEQEFDWNRSLDRMESVYRHVLGRGALTPAAV